ncbi:MAG TPA: hypothetical protein VND19_06385 [Acetobacteraceae bacterium]|nr:hypothetical protein [Acetobacteraceae bacterium]
MRKTVCPRGLGGSRKGDVRAGWVFAGARVTAAKIIAGRSTLTGPAVAGRHVPAIGDTSEVKFPTVA